MFPVRKFYIEQTYVSVRMQFHNYVDTQLTKRFERAMRVYTISNLECCKCTRMKLHCANALLVLRSCAPQREHWSPGSLRDLIATTVNLNCKLGCLSSQKKIKIFHRHILLKAFCHFPNVRMKTNFFCEEAIFYHKVEKY